MIGFIHHLSATLQAHVARASGGYLWSSTLTSAKEECQYVVEHSPPSTATQCAVWCLWRVLGEGTDV